LACTVSVTGWSTASVSIAQAETRLAADGRGPELDMYSPPFKIQLPILVRPAMDTAVSKGRHAITLDLAGF